jgi:Flp pilus assembly protein TadD
MLLATKDQWQASVDLARRSLALNPSYLRATVLLARGLSAGGQIDQAIEVLNDALQTEPNNFALLLLSGELLAEQEMLGIGDQRLRQAKDLAPNQWRPAEILGDAYVRQDNHLKAISEYQLAAEIADRQGAANLTPLLFKLGRTAVQANQHATAQPYLERCVDLSPDHRECRYYLGMCYFVTALPQNGEKAIVNLQASAGTIRESNYYLGVLFDRREEYETARDYYRECVQHGCSFSTRSEARIDEIEAITGTVTAVPKNAKTVSLDVGRIHGIVPGQEGVIIDSERVVGAIRVDAVQEKISTAKLLDGKPLVGHAVRFRPSRPKNLRLAPGPKRGVRLRWKANPEPEVKGYVVERNGGSNKRWEEKRQVGISRTDFLDKSAKPGETYLYRVIALARRGAKSLPSYPASIDLSGAESAPVAGE